MSFELYFQARVNDVHIASGFCQKLESIDGICTEVRCWNGNAFIALSGIGLVVKYIRCNVDYSISCGRVLQRGEIVNEESFLAFQKSMLDLDMFEGML